MMKTYLKLALVSAIALAAVGCQKEGNSATSEESGVKDVTTQFVLNVATAPDTKQSKDIVQLNTNFRGISDAVLMTYITADVPSGVDAYVNKTTEPPTGTSKLFDLGKVLTAGAIDPADNENSSRRILQLTVPAGTDAVLFYGKAPRTAAATTQPYAESKLNGYTKMGTVDKQVGELSTTPSKNMFSAVGILETGTNTIDQYDATAKLMIYVINKCIDSAVDTGDYNDEYKDLPALSWSQLGHQFEFNLKGGTSRYSDLGITLSALEEVMGKAYYNFTFIQDKEYRAGSSNAVNKMIIDMYSVISKAANESGNPTNAKEANAIRLANMILNTTMQYINSSNGKYKTVAEIKSHIGAEAWAAGGFEGAKDLNEYPYGDFGIPEGAAQLGFKVQGKDDGQGGTYAKDEFYYLHPNQPLVNAVVNDNTMFDPRKYVYPAELLYYVNSAIRTSSKSDLGVEDYPNGKNNWSSDSSWGSSWNSKSVGSNTRGVAVKSNINYGVAMLKTAVDYTSAEIFYDNRSHFTDGYELDQSFTKSTLDIQLRGILIGGVNPRMNWQFTRLYTNDSPSTVFDYTKFDGVIYDDQVNYSSLPTTGNETYTLVYDNYNSTDDNQNDVYVTLEFVNNGADFWGKENLIKSGSVFYLLAKLTPTTSSTAITWPTDHQIPPLYGVNGETVPEGEVAGKSKQIPRVFIQDFITSATFRIGEKSLQNAYYSVPDLRSSQMSLGLSVDLSWQSGFNYDITF